MMTARAPRRGRALLGSIHAALLLGFTWELWISYALVVVKPDAECLEVLPTRACAWILGDLLWSASVFSLALVAVTVAAVLRGALARRAMAPLLAVELAVLVAVGLGVHVYHVGVWSSW